MQALSEPDVQRLAEHLQVETSALADFETQLEEEVRALGQVQAHEALASVIAAKQALAERLNALFEARVAMVRLWAPSQLDGNPETLLGDKADLLLAWRRLRRRIQAAQEKNLANGRLIEGYLRQNQAVLDTLHAASGAQHSYTARGYAKTKRTARDLAVG